MRNQSDEALVGAARRGGGDAAGALFERHWPAALRAAWAVCGERAAAEDAAQDAFVKAFASLGSLRGAFRPWLVRIAVNTALSTARRERRRAPLEEAESMADPGWPAADLDLARAVRGLQEDRRVAIVLRYWLSLGPQEIADALGVPVGTVNSRLARGLDQLRADLEVGDARRA